MEQFSDFGIVIKRTHGTEKTICPKCSHERKKSKDPCLSVNIDEKVWKCHHCNWTGHLNGIDKKIETAYTIPQYNNTQLSDNTLNWFLKRGISKATIIHFNLSESKEFMPQVKAERTCINFNYFKEDKLVNIKFRDGQKHFKMVSGAEMVFYGLNQIKDRDEAVICEGEMDALSFYEASVFNVVSVPNGASKGNQKLEYLDNCYQYFEDKKRIIIATDNDEPGIALREELARRLGKERCFIFPYPKDCKDANEILIKHGKEGIKHCMDEVYEYPLEGIETVVDLENDIDHIYMHGFPETKRIGYAEFDELLRFRGGELTLVTGIPGSGKSEFVDQIMVRLASIHDWRCGVFSAENQPSSLHFIKLAEKYIGKSFHGKDEFRITPEELFKAKQFINDKFFFVKLIDENVTVEGLRRKCKELVRRKGIKLFMIDPFNCIEHKIPKGQSETNYINEFLTQLSTDAKTLGIHIILVAHPVKIKKDKDGKFEVPSLYDISGSSHFYNKTDNGLVVYRDFDTDIISVHIEKVRFKFVGKKGSVDFLYNVFSGAYTEKGQSPQSANFTPF